MVSDDRPIIVVLLILLVIASIIEGPRHFAPEGDSAVPEPGRESANSAAR